MADTQTVQVQSAMVSKINWTQVIGALITLAVAFGAPISDAQKVEILAVSGTVIPFITGILKTFFTKTITPASAATLTPTGLAKK